MISTYDPERETLFEIPIARYTLFISLLIIYFVKWLVHTLVRKSTDLLLQ